MSNPQPFPLVTTISGFFESGRKIFAIPSYQRAYTWEVKTDRKQIVQFLADLDEHPTPRDEDHRYYLGHFLFEEADTDCNQLLVIDGQQRLTTLVLFMDALAEAFGEKGNSDEGSRLRKRYVIRADGVQLLRTVEADQEDLRTLLAKSGSMRLETRSTERLKEAREFFGRELKSRSIENLEKFRDLLENAAVTNYVVSGKEQATQIFAFQNDRGKDLSKLEKLKAWLMHQVYLGSPAVLQADAIRSVEKDFGAIYRTIEKIRSQNEDQVLDNHLRAFVGWNSDPSLLLKQEMEKKSPEAKSAWIRDEFCKKLRESFANSEKLERFSEERSPEARAVGDVLYLNAYNSWPLLLKLWHFHSGEPATVLQSLLLMERILFKLRFMKGKSTNSLPDAGREYDGEITILEEKLENWSVGGFKDYWDFDSGIRSFLQGDWHYDKRVGYILWKYENYLREGKPGADQPILITEYTNKEGGFNCDRSIEHIMPQNPEGFSHDRETLDRQINNLGNLVLMTRGKNSQLGNKLPGEKVAILRGNTTYLSHQKVAALVEKSDSKHQWGEWEIRQRKKEIEDFVHLNWKCNPL